MRIFVLTATYELRVSRKIHLRDHPTIKGGFSDVIFKPEGSNSRAKYLHRDVSLLVVVFNENQGGSGKVAYIRYILGPWRSMLFCLLILLSSLISMYFRVRQVNHNFKAMSYE